MNILTLPELVPTKDHPLWWMVQRPAFIPGMLDCGGRAYADYATIPRKLRRAGGGGRRFNKLSENLYHFFTDEYQATIKYVSGQTRFAVPGPGTVQVEVVTRTCHPAARGFSTNKPGIALEQASLLPIESIQYEPGVPSSFGLLVAHRVKPENPEFMQMFVVHEWRARKGARLIECKECALLGEVRFTTKKIERETTGDRPDL